MLDWPDTEELRARVAEVEARRVPWAEVASWIVPWVLAGVLLAVLFAGLWSASSAADTGTYAIGIAGAVLAGAALLWQFATAISGRSLDLRSRLLVDRPEALVLIVALLLVAAAGGLVLAARGGDPATSGAGYGLAFFALVFALANIKHYFDRHAA
jgi:hypothetical protein